MANPEHLKILRQGVDAWNKWRQENPQIIPELSDADLADGEYLFFDFNGIKLFRANLRAARLSSADFAFADFSEADISYANFGGTDLREANLQRAKLQGTVFFNTDLNGADFNEAMFDGTVLIDTDLSETKGLTSVRHAGPSSIGIDTLYASRGKIPDKFLRDAGVPEGLISYFPSLLGAVKPFQWYSCFISYSTRNQEFAERLHARMRQAGLRVWFDREDMKGGDYLHTQIDRAIQLHDRLLLVLSEESIQSKWVEREIRRTRKIERTEKRRKLFPIRLMDMNTLREWECLDSDTGEDLAEEIRKYHIPDFSNWKSHDAFEAAFARLEKDLRASVGR